MRLALGLARRGYGETSPNPMVGAVLVKSGKIIGRGWHRCAGQPHAEIEALLDCKRRGHKSEGATLFVTLEPCSTHGRTPPCTDAIIGAGIKQVIVGATDPNPRHRGKAFGLLKQAGLTVLQGILSDECRRLNESFNHWVVHRTPLVTVKAAMTLDGKIATASGESKWLTGKKARAYGMQLRQGADAILVGINTILADDPSLTWRRQATESSRRGLGVGKHRLRRIILDALARTPLDAKIVNDAQAALTTIVVSKFAPKTRVRELAKRAMILRAPLARSNENSVFRLKRSRLDVRGSKFISPAPPLTLDLRWLLRKLGAEEVTSLLVEGGGEVNASFLFKGLAHRIAFFYAPKLLGGRNARKAVAGAGARSLNESINLLAVHWRRLGADWLLTADVGQSGTHSTHSR